MTTKCGAIYADPPWPFSAWSEKGKDRSAEKHYSVMTVDQICRLEPFIQAIAARDCALFLWATYPNLPDALTVINAWGFKYKTAAFTWLKVTKLGKPAMGLGFWTRSNMEVCLLATRGKPKRLSASVRQVIIAERKRHSEKPAEARDRIRELVPGPYIELFARQRVPGWLQWGNEIHETDEGNAHAHVDRQGAQRPE